MTFWNHFFMVLASIWAPKTTPKRDPKATQNENMKIIDFADTYTLWAHSGPLKIIIFGAFLGPFFRYRFKTSF